ncbi:hypothetical protein RJ639_018682 [Escallonia herrerae]|uniref:protein-serine/threonine phosphatase n=1 Tax=Escallonia herrerae TaxID=1293975 RepID=A0AA88V7H2_9ASTE|nr:hypothetical protein RJ639_018682 [Escallonia herrerae]
MGCVYSKTCIGELCAPRDVKVKESHNVKAGEIGVFSPDSSDGPEGEDQLNQMNFAGDPEAGITRLSRVSQQFLPPDGSRTIKFPSGKYEIRYSYLSQRGYYPDSLDKANQDSYCIHTPFGTNPEDHFFGVFDGHGEYGAQCSQFVKRKLCENLLRNSQFHMDAVEACHAAFLTTNSQLHTDTVDDSMSGTTAITILVRGKMLYVANSGDSRAVIAERRAEGVVAVDLSIDQTPFRLDELERVKLCGARVLTLDQIEGLKNPDVQCWGTEEGDDGDPPRLWVQNGMYPGTAFTRSIGDSIAETIGVVANPEIVVFELTQDHPFFVIASDGVFEFLSSQAVVDMVRGNSSSWGQHSEDLFPAYIHLEGSMISSSSNLSHAEAKAKCGTLLEIGGTGIVGKFKDPRDACAAIVAESYRLWLQYETRTDDITVIVAHINGLTDTADIQSVNSSAVLRPPQPQVVEMSGPESPLTMSWVSRNQRVRNDISRTRLRAIETSLENGQIWVPPSPAHRKTWEEEAHIEHALHDHFLFRKLTDSQCHVLLDCMQRLEVQPGDTVVKQGGEGDCFYVVGSGEFEVSALQDEELVGLYIIQKGQVRITFDTKSITSQNASSLVSENSKQDVESDKELVVEKTEGSYFGEWTLLGERIESLSCAAVGDVMCAVLTKEKFDSVVGPLAKLSQDDSKSKDHSTGFHKDPVKSIDPSAVAKVRLSDLEWKTCLYSTDCSEIGLVLLRDSENLLSLKRFSKLKIKRLGKEAQVLKEKNLMRSISPSVCVPQLLCTCADQSYAGILLNTCIACPVGSILQTPLDLLSAQFCAASVVTALEELHKDGVLYRGVSPDVLMFDHTGHIQLVDFRFGKKLSGERTFTICGMADSLAPEIVQGKGHGLPADWWALGVLIYFMLRGEMPFGSWRESELDTFAKIAKGQVTLPQTFSPEAVDLITKLLEVDENRRLGSEGAEYVKSHPWFDGVDWDGIKECSFPVPHEIISRINQHVESRTEDSVVPLLSPTRDLEELNTPEWLEDW